MHVQPFFAQVLQNWRSFDVVGTEYIMTTISDIVIEKGCLLIRVRTPLAYFVGAVMALRDTSRAGDCAPAKLQSFPIGRRHMEGKVTVSEDPYVEVATGWICYGVGYPGEGDHGAGEDKDRNVAGARSDLKRGAAGKSLASPEVVPIAVG